MPARHLRPASSLALLALVSCGGRPRLSTARELVGPASSAEPLVPGFWEQPAPPWTPGLDAGPEAQSGSRLRARYEVAQGGARRLVGFEDTLRHEPCTFRAAADGAMRCLPDGSLAEYTSFVHGEDCSRPLFLAGNWCHQAPAYGVRREQGCPDRSRIYSLGAEFTAPETSGTTSCPGGHPRASPGQRYFTSVAEIEPSAFVEASIEIESSGARLRSVHLRATDGAAQWVGWYDAWMQERCVFQPGQSGGLACVPEALDQYHHLFADAGCRLPLLVVPSGCPAGPVLAAQDFSSSCPFAARAFVPGAKLDGSNGGYSTSSGTCSTVSFFSVGGDTYRPAREVPPEALVTASGPITVPGQVRLQRRRLVARGGASQLEPGFHDQSTGAACEGRLASDGKLRCLPVSAPIVFSQRYADPACQVPSVYASSTCASGGLDIYRGRNCADEFSVCQYGPVDRLYFHGSTGRCITNDSRGPSTAPGYVWRRCERQRPASDFAELSIEVD